MQAQTTISGIGADVTIAGTQASSDLQHFDSPSNGQLRHLGINPVEMTMDFNFILQGTNLDQYRISLIRNSNAVETIVFTQLRTINKLQGGINVTSFTGITHSLLLQNEFLYWKVANMTSTGNCTLVLNSVWSIHSR